MTQWAGISLAPNADRVEAPLLLQVSDEEVLPATERVAEFARRGRPVEMYIYPGEHHVKSQPAHRYNSYRRNIQWFQFWLQGAEDSEPVEKQQYERWHKLKSLLQASSETSGSPRSDPR
jgi:hypothetical protein